MGKQRVFRDGDLFGFVIEFAGRGDGIAMHKHPAPFAHRIEVLAGSVLVYGAAGPPGVTLEAGAIFDVEPDQPHEI